MTTKVTELNMATVWIARIEPCVDRYKLVVNGKRWIEDPATALKEPDELGA
jgi:hypothetical protein